MKVPNGSLENVSPIADFSINQEMASLDFDYLATQLNNNSY